MSIEKNKTFEEYNPNEAKEIIKKRKLAYSILDMTSLLDSEDKEEAFMSKCKFINNLTKFLSKKNELEK